MGDFSSDDNPILYHPSTPNPVALDILVCRDLQSQAMISTSNCVYPFGHASTANTSTCPPATVNRVTPPAGCLARRSSTPLVDDIFQPEYMGFPTTSNVGFMEREAPSAAPGQIDNSRANYAYSCKWGHCNLGFNNIEELQQHVDREHFPPDRKPCQWGPCRQDYSRYSDLNNHVHKKHLSPQTPQVSFSCPYDGCTKSYIGRKDNLDRHVRTVHKSSNEKSKC